MRMARFEQPERGVWTCTFVATAPEVCPKHRRDPAALIQAGKVESSKDLLIATPETTLKECTMTTKRKAYAANDVHLGGKAAIFIVSACCGRHGSPGSLVQH